MKRVEITFTKYQKELEKLNAQLDRAKKSYEKKLANAVKYGVDTWDADDHTNWLTTVEKINNIYIANKEDIKKNEAWWDLYSAKRTVDEITDSIERAEKRLSKAEAEVNNYREEMNKIEDLKAKEEFAKRTFEEEQKEWAKDGIQLEGRYYGITPSGKTFNIYGNNGFTDRSWHCFTLRINGETIFTSGEFWRAYAIIKKN